VTWFTRLPRRLSQRLFSVVPSKGGISYRVGCNLVEHCGFTGHVPVTYSEFRRCYREFLVYGELSRLDELQELKGDWAEAEPIKLSGGRFLAHVKAF